MPECPTRYGIKKIIDGAEHELTDFEQTVLVHNLDDGSLEIFTDDLSLDKQSWTIKLYKESILSDNDQGAFQFTINFHDICWDSELVAAEFTDLSPSFNLWEEQVLFFT